MQKRAAVVPFSVWAESRIVWLLAGLVLLAFIALGARPAKAQFFQLPGFSGQSAAQQAAARRQRYNRRRYVRKKRRPKVPAKPPAWALGEADKNPAQIIVSLTNQKVTVFQGDKALTTSRVSSGKKGHATPTGVFSILGKSRWHRSNIYSGAPMPFMQRLTWSGIALHASNSVPNHPASHGCVRLPNAFAPQLFKFTEMGAHVVITYKTDLAPTEIAHENLFAPSYPAPKDNDVLEIERTLAANGVKLEKETKRPSDPVRILVTRRTGKERLADVQRLLNELQFNAGDVDGWMGPDTAKAIKRFEKTYGEAYDLPRDGLVTDELIAGLYKAAGKPAPANGHIYVRQKFKQLFDAPATILEPKKPLGSHLVTAQHFEPGANEVRWLYVTLDEPPKEPKKPKKPLRREVKLHNKKIASDEPESAEGILPAPMPSTLSDALDRIEISADVRRRISEILTPGSSLAISDDGLSQETHPKGTDFVLLTGKKK